MKSDTAWGMFWIFSVLALIGASRGLLLIPVAVAAPFVFVGIIAWVLDTKIFAENE